MQTAFHSFSEEYRKYSLFHPLVDEAAGRFTRADLQSLKPVACVFLQGQEALFKTYARKLASLLRKDASSCQSLNMFPAIGPSCIRPLAEYLRTQNLHNRSAFFFPYNDQLPPTVVTPYSVYRTRDVDGLPNRQSLFPNRIITGGLEFSLFFYRQNIAIKECVAISRP